MILTTTVSNLKLDQYECLNNLSLTWKFGKTLDDPMRSMSMTLGGSGGPPKKLNLDDLGVTVAN